MSRATQAAYDYLMADNPVDFFQTLEYLKSIGIEPDESEVDEIYDMVSDIALELSYVGALRLGYDMKRINRLCYGI